MEKFIRYWNDTVPEMDDFGDRIENEFYDARSKYGSWGFMTRKTWKEHSVGKLGMGCGQRYVKTEDNLWMCVEG